MKYRYCPQCGVEYRIEEQNRFEEKQDKIICNECPFVFYNNPIPAVSAIIRNDKNQVLLTKRGIEPFKGHWDLPGGFVDHGEMPDEAIIRELEEELGIKSVKSLEFVDMFDVDYVNEGREDERMQVLTIMFEVEVDESEIVEAKDDVEEFIFFDEENFPKEIAFPQQEKFFKAYFNLS